MVHIAFLLLFPYFTLEKCFQHTIGKFLKANGLGSSIQIPSHLVQFISLVSYGIKMGLILTIVGWFISNARLGIADSKKTTVPSSTTSTAKHT
jgi:hypothetical protein